MAKEKMFTIGGSTNHEGRKTLRVATGDLKRRESMLRHFGHTAINLVELPRAMTKVDAYAWLMKQGYRGIVPTRAANKKAKNETFQLAAAKAGKGRQSQAAA